MRKPSPVLSLRKVLVLSILAGCLGAQEAAAGKCSPPTTEPSFLEEQSCQKWTYSTVDTNNPQKYLNLFPNNCDNTYGTLTCYWSSAEAACKGYVRDKDYDSNLTWTYVGVAPAATPGYKRCKYKIDQTVYDDIVVQFGPVLFSPYQDHCAIEVNGPYRECADKFTLCGMTFTEARRGFEYTTGQKNTIKKLNKGRGTQLKSDLAGYKYPKPANEQCIQPDPRDPSMCIEPANLSSMPYNRDSPEVHHVIPKKDRQGCACGKNSMANAVVISRQLNRHFLNFKRPADEITQVNAAGQNPHSCSSSAAPLSSSPSTARRRTQDD